LKSLVASLSNREEFFRQLKKRFPPNPIQATIDVGGEFNDNPRIFYQVADIFIRIKPSLQRFVNKIRQNDF
jgi:alpha-acetolactate decarboxylase